MFFTLTRLKQASYFLLILFACRFAKAQVEQTGRIQVPIQNDIEAFSIASLDTSGILLHRSYLGPKEGQLEVIRLDTALHQVWKGFITIPKELSLVSTKTAYNKIYFFYKGAQFGGYQVYVVQATDGSYSSYQIKNLIPFEATEFIVSEHALMIGGYFNFRPIVLHFSLKEQRSRILPGFLNEPGELTQIKTYPDGNVDVIISAKNSSRRKCLWIRHFDNSGDLIKTVVLEPEETKNLIFGRAVKTDNDNQVIAGVYGKSSQYSRGIFVADINPYGEYKIHYYNFGDLQNFFHYMKAKREKRIKERIERRKIKGKKVKFNYRFLVHELIPYGNQFIMLGEAFYPRYTNRPNYAGISSYSPWSFAPSGRNFNNSQQSLVFDGFQYTHAVVIGFDPKGELVWDNSFEIHGVKSFQLEQFVKIVPSQDRIVLLYLFENFIRSKIIKDDQVIEGTVQNSVKTFDRQEPAKHGTQTSKLEYWYNHHFFAYGIQTLKKPENDEAFAHKVFFINKMSVR